MIDIGFYKISDRTFKAFKALDDSIKKDKTEDKTNVFQEDSETHKIYEGFYFETEDSLL